MNKRFTTPFAVPAFVAMTFMYSCQKKDLPSSGPMPDGSTVQFTSTVDDASNTKASNATWAANDSIGVYMKNAADASVLSANKKYTTPTVNGNFTAPDALNYPQDGSAVNFVAYYPFQPAISGNIYKVNLASQTSLPAIDLMYANNATGFSKNSSTVPNLSFTHQLARVNIILKAGTGYSNLNGVTATFKQVNTQADFDLNTGTLGTGAAPADVNANISTIAGSADQSVTIILLPQADASGQKVSFKLPSNNVFNWTFPAGTTIEKGKSYNYTVTLQSGLVPVTARLVPATDTATAAAIIDNEWVAIGSNDAPALQKDYTNLFNGNYSYRFELNGTTRDRIELQYVYATAQTYAGVSQAEYLKDQAIRNVMERGKGYTPQGTKWRYTFSTYIPSNISNDASTIFAQIHGSQDRTLVMSPTGVTTLLTKDEYLAKTDTMIFDGGIGYSKLANGNKGAPNGWKVDVGSYPPMEMGFKQNMFYISVASDAQWATDTEDRNGANLEQTTVMQPVTSANGYKTATNVYKMSLDSYPKNTWVTYVMDIDFSTYNGAGNQMTAPGKIDVTMSYTQGNVPVTRHIVNNATVSIGRNDALGYFFKFGNYSPGSTVPFTVNCAGFSQTQR